MTTAPISQQPSPLLASDVGFADISDAMDRLVEAKGWYAPTSRRPQPPRNLAVSLVVEAGELLECFQWTEEPDLDLVADEIADVVLYAVQLSRVAGVDIAEAVMAKLQRNQLRTWDDAGK